MHCCFQGDPPSFDSAEAMRSHVRVLKELVGTFKSGSLGDDVRRSPVEQLSMQLQDLSLLLVLEDDVNLAEELMKEIMVWIKKDPCVHGGRHSSHGKSCSSHRLLSHSVVVHPVAHVVINFIRN